MTLERIAQAELISTPEAIKTGPKEKEEIEIMFPYDRALDCTEEDLARAGERVRQCTKVQLLEEYCGQCSSMRYETYEKKIIWGLGRPLHCQSFYCSKKSRDEIIGTKEENNPAKMNKGIPVFGCDFEKEYLKT